MNIGDYWKLCREVRESGMHLERGEIIRANTDVGAIFSGNVIVIDGSDNFREWASNFRFLRLGRFGTHHGFYTVAEMFFNQIEVKKGESYTIVGHSRGGAVAQIIALLIALSGGVCSVVSFGSPKVGGRRFREMMESNCVSHVRVAMKGDHIPNLPWWWKHYQTDHVELENHERNGIDSHLAYGKYLKDSEGVVCA